VDEVQIDVENGGRARVFSDDVLLPDFLEKGLR
jgi:hypothetical protein